MSPPTYGDLGKQARDIFSKNYNFGAFKLDCKTKSNVGVDISAGGTNVIETGKVSANVETKYKIKEHGLTLTEKWNTDNTLSADLAVEDKFTKGLKVVLSSTFAPHSGAKSGILKTTYKCDPLTVNLDSTLDIKRGPVIFGSAVSQYKNLLLGYQTAFDTAKSKLTKNNIAFGMNHNDFVFHCYANDGAEFGGSMYQRINRDLEGAIDMGWSATSNTTRAALGMKYNLDRDVSVKAKVNNSCQIGLGYQFRVRDGITLGLSCLIDGKNFNQGGHKTGLSLDLEA